MTLQAVIQDKAQIPTGLETYYTEKDGQYVLAVDGMKSQSDFDNFAVALKKRLADAGSEFANQNGNPMTRDDVLGAVQEAFKKLNPGGKSGKDGDGDNKGGAEVENRLHDLERNVASLTEENETLKQERDKANATTRDTTIRNALTEAATAANVITEGIPNIVTLTQKDFEIAQDGSVVTKLDAKGVSPNVSPADYFSSIARETNYRMYWPASKGAGAGSGDGSGGASGDLGSGNPFTRSGWNMTKQGQLVANNRAEAERLAAAAGVKIGATAAVR